MGDLDRVEALLTEDMSLANACAPDGFQPLGLAVFFGHSKVAAYLIAFGAKVNTPSQNAQHVYPLNSAAAAGNLIAARLLLANGAQVDSRQAGDFTPLHNAAQNGQVELVELLLKHGADPAARAANGKTPLDFAREGGHRRVMDLLGS
jgi:ankyrin repeat protein